MRSIPSRSSSSIPSASPTTAPSPPAGSQHAARLPFVSPPPRGATDRWVEHFRASRARDWRIPWDAPAALSPEEHRRIASSVAEFQRGESSEARDYLRLSSLFSLEHRDPAFHEASVLFVREENEHSALLLRFMNGAGIRSRADVFSDAVFRRVRAFGDLAWESRVLLAAELLAQEYYPRLRASTGHPVLRRVCDKLIHDEFAHIRFQVERIARLESALTLPARRFREHLQGALLTGAALTVYRAHRPVLASLGLAAFLRRLLRRFRRATRAIRALHPATARPARPHPGARTFS